MIAVSTFHSFRRGRGVALLGLLLLLIHSFHGSLRAQTFSNVSNINFTKVIGGPDPLPQAVTITSTGSDFDFIATPVNDLFSFLTNNFIGNWLFLDRDQSNGNCISSCRTPSTIQVFVQNTQALVVGNYLGSIFLSPSNGGTGTSISVTLTILPLLAPPMWPADHSTGISLNPTLLWADTGGATSYDIYFGTSPSPALLATTLSSRYTPPLLASNTIYYWQVAAKNASTFKKSEVFSFRTGPLPTLLWQNDTTRQVTVWFMGGTQGSTYLSQNYIGATPGWTLRGAADMNRDGVPDLLWQNDASRDVALWFMGGEQGSTLLSQSYVGTTAGWTLRGTADVNRDGVPDLLWQNDTTRQVTVWFMGGDQGSSYQSQNYIGATPGWTLCGAADMNRDGIPDLLWQNDTTRQVTVWFMGGLQGSTYLSQNYIGATPGWSLRGAADMDRDGVPDLLWQNDTTRQVTVWYMGGAQGSTYLSQNYIGATPGWMLNASQQ